MNRIYRKTVYLKKQPKQDKTKIKNQQQQQRTGHKM